MAQLIVISTTIKYTINFQLGFSKKRPTIDNWLQLINCCPTIIFWSGRLCYCTVVSTHNTTVHCTVCLFYFPQRFIFVTYMLSVPYSKKKADWSTYCLFAPSSYFWHHQVESAELLLCEIFLNRWYSSLFVVSRTIWLKFAVWFVCNWNAMRWAQNYLKTTSEMSPKHPSQLCHNIRLWTQSHWGCPT